MGAEILIVEDDDAIAAGLIRVLDGQGYGARQISRGHEALQLVGPGTELVILDLGLPDIDGIEVCRRLRAARPDLAILILSARDQELDVVSGLDAGADDYLVKPFRLSELLARVRAHLRRRSAAVADEDAESLEAGGVTVDLAARRVFVGDSELDLRPREFDLLALLVARAGRVVTREHLMREVWHTEWLGSTKTLDTHVMTVRQKLGRPEAITTLRGVGYRFEAA
jgi:DNA-binding response OmpR family regulator